MMSNATIALMPEPGGERERHVREQRPCTIEAIAAASAVATATASNGSPAADRIAGLTNTM